MSQPTRSIWPTSAQNPEEYRHAKLLEAFMKDYPIANDSIAYYNHLIDKRLPEIISASIIRIKGPNKEYTPYFYRVQLVRVEQPSRQIQLGPNTLSVPLSPAYCRITNTSLTAEIYVSLGLYQDGVDYPIQFYRDPNDINREGSQVACSIPVELGSKLDHSARQGMSPEARLASMECPSDTGGNFYIDGPRTPQIVDKLALEQCLIIPDPKTGNYNCSFTSTGIIKSIQVVIQMGSGENQGQFRFYLNIIPFKNPESTKVLHTVNFLIALRVMTQLSHYQVIQILERFYPTQTSQAERVKRTLLFTMEASQAIQDDRLINEIRSNLNAKSDYTMDMFRNTLISQAFPEYTSLDTKVYTLCYMCVRYAEYMAGFRPPDNRDAYDHKNFQMAPTQLEVDFRRLWRKTVETVSKSVDIQISQQGRNRVITPDDLFHYISASSTLTTVMGQITGESAKMTDALSKLFTSSLTNRFSGLTMVDPTDVKTPQAVAANVTKIGVAVEKHSYGEGIRVTNPGQMGFVCVSMTPEGEKAGLVKYKAVTCLISMPTNPEIVSLLIEQLIEPHDRKTGYSALLINGMFHGWVDGDRCYNILRSHKRGGNIVDVSITFDGSVVSVYTTTSRMVRPLLIINPVTQQLVIEEKDMWEAPFQQLLQEGCVEFLDPAEMLFCYVAQSYGGLLQQRFNLNKLREQLDLLSPGHQYISRSDQMVDPVYLSSLLNGGVSSLFSNEMINQINLEQDSVGFGAIMVKEVQIIYKRILDDYTRQMEQIKYTHCELDPSAVLGVIASVCPYPEHNQGPRVPYNAGMEKQVVGTNHPFVRASMELSTNFTQMASSSIVSTQVERAVFETVPNSRTPMVAIMPYKGYNQEDATVVKAEAAATGLFSTINYTVLRVMERVQTGGTKGVSEYVSSYNPEELNDPNSKMRWEKPIKSNAPPPGSPPGTSGIYDKLDKTHGIVMPGSQVGPGDCLVFRIREIIRAEGTSRGKFYEDASLYVPDGYSGRVDAVVVTNNSVGKSAVGGNGRTISIRLVNYRAMKVGDKVFASYSQKSTVSLIEPKANLPYTKRADGSKGFSPDMFVSPMTIPSRMTIGMMIEAIMNKAVFASGSTSLAFTDATGFRRHIPLEDLGNPREYRRYVAEAMKVLEVNGYRPDGTEILYDVDDQGKEFQIKTPITVAPIRYRLLPHRATSKAQVRSAGGPIRRTTRQPRGGKARGSGLRVGEMERDAIISFGASNVLREELCLASDSFRAVFCVKCGVVAIVDYQNARIECKRCRTTTLLDVVQHGNRRRYTVQDPDQAGQNFCTSTIPYIMLYISNLLGGAMLDFRLGYE